MMTSLVSELDMRKRVALFEHFVKIAVALRELKNFNGCLEIISGMFLMYVYSTRADAHTC